MTPPTILKGKKLWKNVSLDAEMVIMLNEAADKLQTKFGFRPTLSQTIKYLIQQGITS
jgi:hypothetical protein